MEQRHKEAVDWSNNDISPFLREVGSDLREYESGALERRLERAHEDLIEALSAEE